MSVSVSDKKSIALETFLAFLQRAVVLAMIVAVSTIKWQGVTHLRDGEGYLNLATACLTGNFAAVPHGDTQYFIGYPFILSLFMRLLPSWLAVYTLQLASIAGTFWFARELFPHPWITRWLVFGMPTYVLFTSFNMSEALLIFLFYAALWAFLNKRYFLLSGILSIAMITRPRFTCFLYVVLIFEMIRQKQFRAAVPVALMPCLAILVMLLFNHWAFGEFLYNFKLYSAHEKKHSLIALPFQGLLTFSQDNTMRLSNKIYVWAFTLFTFLGVFLLWIKIIKKSVLHPSAKILLNSSVLQLLFLLSLNSRWAFLEFPRYLIPILPAALWGIDHPLLRNKGLLIFAGLIAMAFAIYAEGTGNRYAH